MRTLRHGHARKTAPRNPTWEAWKCARTRCRNPGNKRYAQYGGRGITFSSAWDDYEQFLADMGERPEGMSLDRIDNNKGYEPGNCRWATRSEQERNKSKTRRYPVGDRMLCAAEIAELTGINISTILGRLSLGWPIERILATPSGVGPRKRRAKNATAAIALPTSEAA